MKTIDIEQATGSLADYARQVNEGTVVITRQGQPVAALVGIEDSDWETLNLCLNPQFMGIIDASRCHHKAGGGMSSEEVRTKFGLTSPDSPGDVSDEEEAPDAPRRD